jgi:hypothetical protein
MLMGFRTRLANAIKLEQHYSRPVIRWISNEVAAGMMKQSYFSHSRSDLPWT